MNYLKHYLLILCSLFAGLATAQPGADIITIKSLTINAVMQDNLKQWASANISMNATNLSDMPDFSPRLVVQIRRGSDVVCGNHAASGMIVMPFSSKIFDKSTLLEPLSACSNLNSGNYTLCVRFYNDKAEPVSNEVCQEFTVQQSDGISYEPPQNVAPQDNKYFVGKEATAPITFRWLPPTPEPDEPVTYRLRITNQLATQTPEAAIIANQPLITKDIAGATEVTLPDGLSIDGNSVADGSYVWNVQAINKQGQPLGANEGKSKPFSAIATSYIIRIDSIKVACTATPGVYSFSYTIVNLNSGTAKLTNLVATSSAPAGASISSFAPPLNTNIPPGGVLTITGTLSASASLSNICIGAQITDVANTFNQASKDTCIPVSPCKCDACEPRKANISISPSANITVNANNTLSLTQPITITTTPAKLIKSIKAELVYFEFVPESEECLPCNKDSKTFGNFESGILSAVTAQGVNTHSLYWNYSPPKSFSSVQNAAMTITLPPTVKCCAATIKWCIRYVVTFADCTVCSKVVCYQKKKDSCTGGNGNPNSSNN